MQWRCGTWGPMSRPPLRGHAPVAPRLERAVREGTLAHATLLAGPDGVGKTTLAEAVAPAVLDAGAWPGGLRAHPGHWLEDSADERLNIAPLRPRRGTPRARTSPQGVLRLPKSARRRAGAVS